MKRILLTLLFAVNASSLLAQGVAYSVALDGPTEPSASLGLGSGYVIYNGAAHTLELQLAFSGLTGTTTASHIHAATLNPFSGTAGVATTTPTFAGFPAGVTSGTFTNTLDLTLSSSFNPSYVTANGGTLAGAEAALAAAMASGRAYWNVHTSTSPGGEIRGFLVAVPEPSSVALLALGGAVATARCRRKRTVG